MRTTFEECKNCEKHWFHCVGIEMCDKDWDCLKDKEMKTSKIGTWDKRGYPKYLPYEACKRANREAMSEDDNRRFCYGLIDLADDEICSVCKECGYYIDKEEA